jgi:hypothetical protein
MVLLLLCLVTLLMVTGCGWLFPKRSPKVRTVPLAKVSDDVVKLERSFSADGVAVNMDYDHPHEFSEQTMQDEVGLLVVRRHKWGKYGVGSEWVSKPAFTAAATARLVPALVTAFKEASRSDKILFNVPGQTGQPTFGEVYLQDDKLVWIFKEIDGRTFLGKDIFTLDGEDWRIEEKTGMTVRKNKNAQVMKVVRDLSVAPDVTTAAVVEERPSQPAPQAPALSREVEEAVVTPGEVISPGLDELEEKLQTLKKWKDTGLITDEDYEKEKAQILKQLQQL